MARQEAHDSTLPAVRLEGVRKTYRKGGAQVTPLDGVGLTVERGEFLALMGPSGSGKTTLLNLIAGIDRPTEGRVVVLGREVSACTEDELADFRTRSIGYVFQQFHLMPVLTALENVELPLLLLPLSRRRRREQAMAALELVGLAQRAGHHPHQLSGGEEQRVAIARAVATDPAIVLADEPTGNLDRASAEAVMDLLVELHGRLGKTVVLVTHDAGVASRARRVLRLDKGVLLEEEKEEQAAAPEGRP